MRFSTVRVQWNLRDLLIWFSHVYFATESPENKKWDLVDFIENIHFFLTRMTHNFICIPISFNNSLKASFSNKKYITIQTHPTKIVKVYLLFLNKKKFCLIFKDYWCTNLITYNFFQISKVTYFISHTRKYLTLTYVIR